MCFWDVEQYTFGESVIFKLSVCVLVVMKEHVPVSVAGALKPSHMIIRTPPGGWQRVYFYFL